LWLRYLVAPAGYQVGDFTQFLDSARPIEQRRDALAQQASVWRILSWQTGSFHTESAEVKSIASH
jgi:hypothetical protein